MKLVLKLRRPNTGMTNTSACVKPENFKQIMLLHLNYIKIKRKYYEISTTIENTYYKQG